MELLNECFLPRRTPKSYLPVVGAAYLEPGKISASLVALVVLSDACPCPGGTAGCDGATEPRCPDLQRGEGSRCRGSRESGGLRPRRPHMLPTVATTSHPACRSSTGYPA